MKDQIAGIARAIAGTAAPPWLTGAIPRLVDLLHSAIEKEDSYPSRRDLRRRLATLGKAARFIQCALVNQRLLPLLLKGPSDQIANENETYHGLSDIVERTEAALRRPEFSHGGKPKRGRHKVRATFDDSLDNHTLCALMVGIAWKCARGRWPGQQNPPAHRACTMLWNATGAKWNNTDVSWRPYLVKARDMKGGRQAAVITRMLGQANAPTSSIKRNGRLAAELYRKGG
jgi:hypothetical protein